MRKKPVRAEDSLLLDYVGPNYFAMVSAALKHRHWTILLVLSGSILIALATVVATSLWVVGSHTASGTTVALRRTSSFSVDSFSNQTDSLYLTQFTGGIIYQLPPPLWMVDGYAFSSFDTVDTDLSQGRLDAVTEAYSASLSCEKIDVSDAGKVVVGNYSMTTGDPFVTYKSKLVWNGCEQVVNVTTYSVPVCEYTLDQISGCT